MLEIVPKLTSLQHDHKCTAGHCPLVSGEVIVSQESPNLTMEPWNIILDLTTSIVNEENDIML